MKLCPAKRSRQIYLDQTNQTPQENSPVSSLTSCQYDKEMEHLHDVAGDICRNTGHDGVKMSQQPQTKQQTFCNTQCRIFTAAVKPAVAKSASTPKRKKPATRTKRHTASGFIDVSQFSSGSSQHGSTAPNAAHTFILRARNRWRRLQSQKRLFLASLRVTRFIDEI